MRRLLTAVLVCATLAGCSKPATTEAGAPGSSTTVAPLGTSSTAPGTTKPTDTLVPAGGEYCDIVERINAVTGEESSKDKPEQAQIDAVLRDTEAATKAAPSDLTASWEVVAAGIEELATLPTDDDPTAALEIVTSPEFTTAIVAVSEYTQKTCGFGLEGFTPPTGSNEKPPSTKVGGGSGGGDDEDDAGLPEACSGLSTIGDDDKTDPTSLYSVRRALCLDQPDASWLRAIVRSSSWSALNDTEWTVTIPDDMDPPANVSKDDALEVCEAMDDYLTGVDIDAKIVIGIGSMSEAKPSTVLASKDEGGTCS